MALICRLQVFRNNLAQRGLWLISFSQAVKDDVLDIVDSGVVEPAALPRRWGGKVPTLLDCFMLPMS